MIATQSERKLTVQSVYPPQPFAALCTTRKNGSSTRECPVTALYNLLKANLSCPKWATGGRTRRRFDTRPLRAPKLGVPGDPSRDYLGVPATRKERSRFFGDDALLLHRGYSLGRHPSCFTHQTCPAKRHTLRAVVAKILQDQAVSATWASGAFFLTDAMPFSIPELREYISLFPMVCPLAAVRTK